MPEQDSSRVLRELSELARRAVKLCGERSLELERTEIAFGRFPPAPLAVVLNVESNDLFIYWSTGSEIALLASSNWARDLLSGDIQHAIDALNYLRHRLLLEELARVC